MYIKSLKVIKLKKKKKKWIIYFLTSSHLGCEQSNLTEYYWRQKYKKVREKNDNYDIIKVKFW